MPNANLDDLQAALHNVLLAPKDRAPIEQLCLRPDVGVRNFVDEIEVTREFGIPGERWSSAPWLTLEDGRPDPRIQVSILSKRVLDLVYNDPQNMVHPGDSFVADMDFSHENIPDGTLLNIGSVVLRVSDKFNTACKKWQDRYGQDALRWIVMPCNRKYRLRGVLCEVIKDGRVKTGDLIQKA
jgi:MOSC domain